LIGGEIVTRLIGFSLLLAGAASSAFAGGVVTVAPEIDGASAATAFVLLSGGLLVLRARRKK
jgi:hypothetical protein